MSFGETILKKFGWSEGKGLGREENGIKTFIKPKLKLNLSGVGHNVADEHSFHWWDHLYNKAANNISIKKKPETGAVEVVRTEDLKISTKKSSLKKHRDLSGYGNFVKGCVLDGGKIIENTNTLLSKEEEPSLELIKNYSDQELFKMFGGHTAHKGARHGIKMSAKLARIEEQEKHFLQKTDSINNPVKEKKRKRHEESSITYNVKNEENMITGLTCVEEISEEKRKKKKKKKKKEHQQHSDNENAICSEYVPVFVEQDIFPTGDCEVASCELKHKSKKKKKKRKKENCDEF
ncbi:G patch domain-containing protein 4 [Armadillidium nasatum]|uniref:G patch domain-containing protein 4 n=1 Tax=Armadillidium nasatum TaxID=96803 RepID=A0A5N5SPI4_9CRUS|nr:G patch domain-containing protein 4 [Armadillidium nasatum]